MQVSLDKAFQDWLSHPADLPADLVDIVRVFSKGTALEAAMAEAGGWLDLLRETSSTMERAVGAWRGDYETLQNAWEAVAENPSQADLSRSRNEANALRYQIQLLTETTVIEWLADNRFLPRYGFPINLQRLEVRQPDPKNPDRSRQDDRVRLQRSSLLALGEYVPGAKVLAGGRTATSRGLLKYWTETTADKSLGHGEFLITCANKHLYLSRDKNKSCPECDEAALTSQMLLLPRYGYLTAAWEPPTRRIDFERVGEAEIYPIEAFVGKVKPQEADRFGGIRNLAAAYYEESESLLRNEGAHRYGFAICTRCGFSMSEETQGEGREGLPKRFASHAPVFEPKDRLYCWKKTEAPVIRNRTLAAKERTDLIVLQFPPVAATESAVLSLGRALVLAGARILEVDSRELDARPKPSQTGGASDLLVFDSGSSGAGHCRELFDNGEEWFSEARNVLEGDPNHDKRCETACLDCILDFSGQFGASKLDRHAALKLLD